MSKLREMRKASKEKTNKFNAKLLALPVVGVIALIALIAFLSPQQAGLVTLPEIEEEPLIGEIKTFTNTGKEIETIDGKPVIRLFSTTWCPHCKWISGTYEKVVKEYAAAGKIVAYHWEFDIKDDTLTEETEGTVPEVEMAVFQGFNPRGTVPTFVFGGRYARIGNGYESQNDLAAEEAEFRAVIEALLAELEE